MLDFKVTKKHNKPVVVEMNNDRFFDLIELIIDCEAGTDFDTLKIFVRNSATTYKASNSSCNIALDMQFGGGYELRTGEKIQGNIESLKHITFLYKSILVTRIQKLRYEINNNETIGKLNLEILLT